MVLGNAAVPVSKRYDSRLPAERGHSVFLSTKQNPALPLSLLLAENQRNIVLIFFSVFFFFLSNLCSRLSRKWQWGNTELANRVWQCCFSMVWVTLERRRVCRWKIQSRCESGMQNNPTGAEWIILSLWWGQIISGLLLSWVWRDAKEGQSCRRKTRSRLWVWEREEREGDRGNHCL